MHRPVQSTLVYCRAVQTGRTWLSMTKQRLNLCSVTGGYAESCALKLWVSLWLKSSLPLPGFLISFPTRKLNHSYTLLFQQRYDGKWSWRKYFKKNCLTQTHTHTSQNVPLMLFSLVPLCSASFSGSVFARSASGTALCLRNHLRAVHCPACVRCVCLCKHVHSYPPAQSVWVPPSTNWLVKEAYSQASEWVMSDLPVRRHWQAYVFAKSYSS